MNKKRLQEIKNKVENRFNLEDSVLYDELITAVEQAQEELAEAQDKLARAKRYLEHANTGRSIFLEETTDLREQLADMQIERIALEHGAAHIESELTEQLATSRGLSLEQSILLGNCGRKLREAEAENKRFRHMNGFTPDASRDK